MEFSVHKVESEVEDFWSSPLPIELKIEAILETLREQYNLAPIQIVLNGRIGKFLGRANYATRLIEINPLIVHNSRVLEDTIRHEFAHILSYDRDNYAGHGEAWKTAAKEVGANPEAIQPWVKNDVRANGRKWIYECGQGCQFARIRRSKKMDKRSMCGAHKLPLKARLAD